MKIMSEILKAAKLDFCLVRPYFKGFRLPFVMALVFCAVNRSLAFGVFFTILISTMLIGYPFSISENHGMEKMYGILPVLRKHLVIGRYLFTCSIGLMVSLFSPIINSVILKAFGETVLFQEICTTAVIGFGIFSLYTVFQLPGFYKNGALRGKGLMYIIPIIVYLVVMLILPRLNTADGLSFSFIVSNPAMAAAAVLLVFILAYWFSITASIRALQNKEV